jgi:signal transduction histidine kinase
MGMTRLMTWIGVKAAAGRGGIEMRRALGQVLLGTGVLLAMAVTWPWRDGAFGSPWLAPAVALGYALFGLADFLGLCRGPISCGTVQYAASFAKPAVFALFLCDAPQVTAFLSPYAMLLAVPAGMHHGPRSFWLAWAGSLLTVPPILYFGHKFWSGQPQLLLALVFVALLAAAFFATVHEKLNHRWRQEMETSKQRALEEAMVAKSAFLARVSHQLRSPLQAIVSSLELMESPTSHRAMRHQLAANISASAAKLTRELTDLLTIARADAWQLPLHPATFDARMLLETVATEMLEHHENQGKQILRIVPRELLFLVADAEKIVHILVNVAEHVLESARTNALTLAIHPFDSKTGTVTFMVKSEMQGAGGARAVPVSGRGWRDELHDHLGLRLVHTLVEFLGGRLESSSTAGVLQYNVVIPCETVSDDDAPPQSAAAQNMLLVTPADSLRAQATKMLERLGWVVDTVATVPVAANRLSAKKYAHVLVDLNLPRRGALQLAMGMKNGDGPNRETPVWSFNAQLGTTGAAGAGEPGPFDATMAGPLSGFKLPNPILVQQPGKSRH